MAAQPQAAASGRPGDDEGWRATPLVRCAGGGDQAAAWRQGRHGVHQDPSSLSIWRPSSAATFFWSSMIASARSKRFFRRRLSRCERASSAAKGFGSAVFGPRLAGLSASKAPRGRRADAASPSGPTSKAPRGAQSRRSLRECPAARSASARMRNLSRAVMCAHADDLKVQAQAAAGAETIVGLRPSSASAPAAARVLLSLIWGITTGCLSYAPKGKLPAGLCLIIIGTEGSST